MKIISWNDNNYETLEMQSYKLYGFMYDNNVNNDFIILYRW